MMCVWSATLALPDYGSFFFTQKQQEQNPPNIAAHQYSPAWPYPCAHVLIQLKSPELRICSNAAVPSQPPNVSGRSHRCCCQLGCETSFLTIPGPHQLDVEGSFGPTSPQNCIARRSHSGLPRAH